MLRAGDMLAAYATGIFPMAEGRASDDIFWVNPERRGVFPVGGFHTSRSLARKLRSGRYEASLDAAFAQVVARCAGRDETWINADLVRVYDELHATGAARSLEIWDGKALVGGVFGLTIGAAFFGESMFSAATDGSKMALAVLHRLLVAGGFRLFDVQFLTPHLASLGAVELSRADYLRRLQPAVRGQARLHSGGASSGAGSRFSTGASASGMTQESAQTS
ncbi:MAG: leucyl/phenylalanyl-tRNA--protein transferase [Rubellimicrobium sp.]|nr:leucyl/phenylalanyl-tRNA--protein transferase [Rubellimicrobium sp.]